MERAIRETERRRKIQGEYNLEHGITPETIQKEIREFLPELQRDKTAKKQRAMTHEKAKNLSDRELADLIHKREAEMFELAKNLKFEQAAKIRDELKELRKQLVGVTS
jgi:excinuclease ABC subunit B